MRIVPVEARPEDGPLIGGHFKIAEVIGMPSCARDTSDCGAFVEIDGDISRGRN